MASRKPKTGTAAHGAPAAPPPSPPPADVDRSRRFLDGQSAILQQVAAGAPLPDVLCGISRLVEQHAPEARCAVALFDRDGRRLRHVKGPHVARQLLDAVSALGPESAEAPWARTIAERRPRMIADLSDAAISAELRQGASAAGFRACLAHPISGEGDRLLGMFMLFYPDAGAAQPEHQVVVELLSPVLRIAVDLDQRLQALHSADERFTSLASSIPGVVYQRLVTPEGQIRYTYISDGVRDLFGVSPDEVLADPQALFNRHDPSYAATFRERLLSASRTLEMWDVEATIISRDGKQKHTHAIARPHQQRDGSVLWNGLILDQTRIKKAELAATAAEARTREAIIESLPQGLTLFDADDRLTVCNSAYLKLYPQAEGVAVAGADYASVIRAEFEHESAGLPIDERLAARLEQRHGWQHSIERQLADGRWILISERRTADGGTVILHTDISTLKRREEERSKLQDQLYRAQKMEAMGRLAGGIAHDFNNLLASILGNAAFLVEDLPAGSETWDFAEQIRTAGERAKHLVQQILAFSRQQESEQTNIDPESIVNETLQLMRAALPKSISLNLHLRSDKVTIRGNPTQLVQVLVNLCVNARDAIGNQHGSIDIETDLVCPGTGAAGDDAGGMRHDPQHLATAPLQPNVQYLRIKVRDTGCGMDARIMERMFEPFFTTKEVGKGTGLGLAAVHGIVSAHGGVVAATSRPGHGTSFDVFIPTIAEPASVAADTAEDKPCGSESILIVDDEPQVSSMLAKMLGRIGYRVDCFNSAPDAVEAFKREPGRWSLVITDQTMPQMTGLELARRMLAHAPNLPVILCSGYTDSISNDMVAAAGIKAFLTKPVDHVTLARLIRELLAAHASSRAGKPAPVSRAPWIGHIRPS